MNPCLYDLVGKFFYQVLYTYVDRWVGRLQRLALMP